MDQPFPAYQGDEPYVFVCYAHEDEGVVYPEIGWLHEQGINLWYDEGISAGKVWRAEIAEAIQGASTFLHYISSASLASEHCNREVNFALNRGFEVLPVYLEQVDLTPELDLALSRVQALHRGKDENYQQHLLSALGESSMIQHTAVVNRKRPVWPLSGWGSAFWAGLALFVALLALGGWWALASDPLSEPSTVVQERGGPPSVDELTIPGFGGRPAIAVLPFDNLSGDPEQEYFADGIAEDLITRLSLWRSFPVIARNSSFAYKGQAIDVKQVGKELGVRYIAEGSVRRAGDRVRISAQLIDSATGHHVWANRYDRELADIFAIQDEISSAIAASMIGEVERIEGEQARRQDPGNLEAWDLYQRGLWYYRRQTAAGNVKAREFLAQAIELDPYFASAHGRLAAILYWDIFQGWADSPARAQDQLFYNARRSIELDPRDPLGYQTLAGAFTFTGDGEKMSAAAQRAVDLNPSSPEALSWLAWGLAALGQVDEAIVLSQAAVRLDPNGPSAWLPFYTLAFAYTVAGRYQDAIETSRRGMELRPEYLFGHLYLAASFVGLDRVDEARLAVDDAFRVQPDLSEDLVRRSFAFGDRVIVDRFIADLRKAGLDR